MKIVEAAIKCPTCGGRIHRSRTRGFERVLKLWAIRPFRCAECNQRFFSKRARKSAAV